MEKNKTVLVVDIGTQSVRSSIVDTKGNILAMCQRKYKEPFITKKNGYIEQRPEFYLEEMRETTQYLNEKHSDLLSKAEAMSVAAFRDTQVCLDENKKPLMDSILWLDQRSAAKANKLKFPINLGVWIVGMWPTLKFSMRKSMSNWISQNKPDIWEKTRHFVPLTTYWNYKMTGILQDSEANIIGHYPIDYKKGEWYKQSHFKADCFGFRKEQLCPIVKVGEVLGLITKEASDYFGIPEGLRLMACGTDKTSETLGDGCLKSNCAAISYGTACTVSVSTKKYMNPEPFLPAYKAPVPGYYQMEVQIYRGFWMLKWFINEFLAEKQAEHITQAIDMEDFLDTKMLDIEPGCNGLVLQPYWGPSLRRPRARGAIVGFSDIHTKYHIYRAIVEGIGFALREGLDGIVKKTRKKIEYLVVSGGGSKNDIICQITADLFNLPVKKCATTESCTIGAAIATFMAIGEFQTIEQAVTSMVHYEHEFIPDPAAAKKYEHLYKKVYLKIFDNLNKTYINLKEFSNNEIL